MVFSKHLYNKYKRAVKCSTLSRTQIEDCVCFFDNHQINQIRHFIFMTNYIYYIV